MDEEVETIYGRMTYEKFEEEYKKRQRRRRKESEEGKKFGFTVVNGGG